MNVYDAARTLATAIEESKEYTEFLAQKELIQDNTEVKKLLDDFQKLQLELQKKQVIGENIKDDEMKNAQDLFDLVNKVPMARKYFEAEMVMNQMMGEISKILADAMKII